MVALDEFFSIQANLVKRISGLQRRFLAETIDWNRRLLGITGARGTGKTTLLLQHLASVDRGDQRYLYISADHIRVQAIGLYETAAYFFRLGGKAVLIDEIHKYADWSQEVKNLYDAFPDAKIWFSGSSTLALQKAKGDLSRRIVFENLPALSFREYLYFSGGKKFEPISLSNLLNHHARLASRIMEEGPVLGHFKNYLTHGVYPYFLESTEDYFPKLLNVMEKVLYEDIPTVTGMKSLNVPVLKRILWLVATSEPFTPNIERMSRNLKISKEYVYTYLDYLYRAGLLSGFLPSETGYRMVRKAAKIYLENTNLLKALTGEIGTEGRVGTVRETFFAHQLKSAGQDVRIPKQGDFLINGKVAFEIGGRGKKKSQIESIENAFLIRDEMEVGYANVIPLWLFGFLY